MWCVYVHQAYLSGLSIQGILTFSDDVLTFCDDVLTLNSDKFTISVRFNI